MLDALLLALGALASVVLGPLSSGLLLLGEIMSGLADSHGAPSATASPAILVMDARLFGTVAASNGGYIYLADHESGSGERFAGGGLLPGLLGAPHSQATSIAGFAGTNSQAPSQGALRPILVTNTAAKDPAAPAGDSAHSGSGTGGQGVSDAGPPVLAFGPAALFGAGTLDLDPPPTGGGGGFGGGLGGLGGPPPSGGSDGSGGGGSSSGGPGSLGGLGHGHGPSGPPIGGQFHGPHLGSGAPVVPEPAAWAMMLVGFGCVGAGLRRRRAIRAI